MDGAHSVKALAARGCVPMPGWTWAWKSDDPDLKNLQSQLGWEDVKVKGDHYQSLRTEFGSDGPFSIGRFTLRERLSILGGMENDEAKYCREKIRVYEDVLRVLGERW